MLWKDINQQIHSRNYPQVLHLGYQFSFHVEALCWCCFWVWPIYSVMLINNANFESVVTPINGQS